MDTDLIVKKTLQRAEGESSRMYIVPHHVSWGWSKLSHNKPRDKGIHLHHHHMPVGIHSIFLMSQEVTDSHASSVLISQEDSLCFFWTNLKNFVRTKLFFKRNHNSWSILVELNTPISNPRGETIAYETDGTQYERDIYVRDCYCMQCSLLFWSIMEWYNHCK